MTKRTYFISICIVGTAIVAVLFAQHRAVSTAPEQPNAVASATTAVATSQMSAPHQVASLATPPTTSTQNTISSTTTRPIPTEAFIPVTASGTVLQAMRQYASSSSFMFTGENYPSLGFFVESIGGRMNGEGFYWILYINGTSSALGASSAEVAPGDSVVWRFEKSY